MQNNSFFFFNSTLIKKKKKSHHCCFYRGGVHAGEEGQGTLRGKRQHEFETGPHSGNQAEGQER